MRSNTGRTHTGPIILDTNLVVYAFADVSYFSRIEPSEQAKARICVSVLYLSRCEVIIPSIIAEVETWDIEVLRRAAGLYNRLVRAGLGNWAQRRHQDLIILATAELHGAGILTADHDFLQLIEKTGSKASLHLFTIDEKGRISIEKKTLSTAWTASLTRGEAASTRRGTITQADAYEVSS
ncbi:MAG: hypothetical protein DRK00_02020 [Thermoprotei archaeon]|nr:MAG: hypothetical protein DRK00_02020 [Thermoprotei archaeon]